MLVGYVIAAIVVVTLLLWRLAVPPLHIYIFGPCLVVRQVETRFIMKRHQILRPTQEGEHVRVLAWFLSL